MVSQLPAAYAKKGLLFAQSNGVLLQDRNATESRPYWLPRALEPRWLSGTSLSGYSVLGLMYLGPRLKFMAGSDFEYHHKSDFRRRARWNTSSRILHLG